MTANLQTISWDHLSDYLAKGLAAELPLANGSRIAFLIKDGVRSLGLRLPAALGEEPSVSPFRELEIAKRMVNGDMVIEIFVCDEALFSAFYHFCNEIYQLVSQGFRSTEAIDQALTNWSQLLIRKQLMKDTEQVGLAGELCLLHALIASNGPGTFASWLGPAGETHDFRLESNEIEVKSTTRDRRVHHIHGLGQLVPSTGMRLFLLSLQFEPAGNALQGRTLVERVEQVRVALSGEPSLLVKFDEHLENLGYRDADASFYNRKLKFRNPPVLIPVTDDFPRLTTSMVETMLSAGLCQRIMYVEYDIDVDGLGYPEGSPEYISVMKNLKILEHQDE